MHEKADMLQKLQDEISHHQNIIAFLEEKKNYLLNTEKSTLNQFYAKQKEFEKNVGTWKYLLHNSELQWSDKLLEILELDPNYTSLSNKITYLSSLDKVDLARLVEIVKSLKNGGQSFEFRHTLHLSNNKLKEVDCLGFPIYNQNNDLIGYEGLVTEVNPSSNNKTGLEDFFEASVDLQCIANEQGYFVKVSPSWSDLLGYTNEELCSRPFIEFVHPDDYEKTLFEANRMNNGELSINFENRYKTKSGEVVTLNWNSKIDRVAGLIYCTARDVTEERAEQQKLRVNLSEKEMLLREIHHRVKNNLQVISSLLSLQANIKGEKYPALKKLYADSQSRINSMAAIHELFYRSEGLKLINFKIYLQKLIVDIIHTFQHGNTKVNYEIIGEDVLLDLDTAIPLGLVSNELASNAIKHGFSGIANGNLEIEISSLDDATARLIIRDNGVGNVPYLLNSDEETLGMTIVKNLVDQIDGEISQLELKKGTGFEIRFPINKS